MEDRRQVIRQKPIVSVLEDEREFIARPLSWMEANDYGNQIIIQNTEGLNQFVQLYVDPDTDAPQLEMKLRQKISDWHTLLKIAYPDVPEEQWTNPRPLDTDECAALAIAALEVNHLEHLKNLVDPNSPTLTNPGGNDTSDLLGMTNGQKTASTPDSESSDSQPVTPLP